MWILVTECHLCLVEDYNFQIEGRMLHGYPGVKLPRTPQFWYPSQQGNYSIWLYVWIVWIWVSGIAWWINEYL